MPYQKFENSFLNLLGLFKQTETPVLSDEQAVSGNGLSLGLAAINNLDKRFWIGMGKYQAPIEISSVNILKNSGETPSLNKTYNPGTLIINTVDNLAWIGTGNTGTANSFIPLNSSQSVPVYVTGINLSTAGELLITYSNGTTSNLGDVIELNDPNYPVDGGNFDLDGGEF